jgi:hypothetical protein
VDGELTFAAAASQVQFPHEIIRLCHQPVEPLLHGGLGQLPLAPLFQVPGGNPACWRDGLTKSDELSFSKAGIDSGARMQLPNLNCNQSATLSGWSAWRKPCFLPRAGRTPVDAVMLEQQ